MTFIEGAAGAFHFFQDVGGACGPDERFRTFVVAVDVGADGHNEFFQVAEDAAAEPVVSQVAKETFHHVEPRRAGGSEVQMKAGMPRQPALHFGVLIRDRKTSFLCHYSVIRKLRVSSARPR